MSLLDWARGGGAGDNQHSLLNTNKTFSQSINLVFLYPSLSLTGPRLLTTVMVIKPLAFRKHLSKILKRIAQENFTVVAARLTTITSDRAKELVPKDDQKVWSLFSLGPVNFDVWGDFLHF